MDCNDDCHRTQCKTEQFCIAKTTYAYVTLHAQALAALDAAFVGACVAEAALQVAAWGLVANGPRSYLRSPWNCLDLLIVAVGGLQMHMPCLLVV